MHCTVLYSTVLCLALLPFASTFLFGQQQFCPLGQKCCPDGERYDLGPPWKTLIRLVPPPRCIEYPVKYLLSNRSNPTYPVVFSTANFSQIQGYYNASKPTVIVFHGYLGSEDTVIIRNITGVYLTKVDANAIYVDYSNISTNANYFQDVSDIRVAARYVTKAVKSLIRLGTSPSAIHLIGYSLGAHLAAYVAKDIYGIGRLTGLDPAGPLFKSQRCEVRLCKGDALFTEAIHTNGHPWFGLGIPDEIADVDFWVNGGWQQPNCVKLLNPEFLVSFLQKINTQIVAENSCSHITAALIYTEALAGNCTIWGVKPNGLELSISRWGQGYPTKNIINITGCRLDYCVPIGLQTIRATGRGNYIVPTNYESPFCVSQS